MLSSLHVVSWCHELFMLSRLNLTVMTLKERCWSYRQKSTVCKVCSATFMHLSSVSHDSYSAGVAEWLLVGCSHSSCVCVHVSVCAFADVCVLKMNSCVSNSCIILCTRKWCRRIHVRCDIRYITLYTDSLLVHLKSSPLVRHADNLWQFWWIVKGEVNNWIRRRERKEESDELRELLGLDPVSLVIEMGRLRCCGHVEQDDSDWVKQWLHLTVHGTIWLTDYYRTRLSD